MMIVGATNILINDKEKEYKIQSSEKIKKVIIETIVNKYEELEFWYLQEILYDKIGKACRIDKLIKIIKIYKAINNEKFKKFLEEKCNIEIQNLTEKVDEIWDSDMYYIINLIDEIKRSNLDIRLEPQKLIEDLEELLDSTYPYLLKTYKMNEDKQFKKELYKIAGYNDKNLGRTIDIEHDEKIVNEYKEREEQKRRK